MSHYRKLALLGCCVLFIQCAKPVAVFDVDKHQDVIPAQLTFSNKSKASESYIWKVNGEVVSTNETLDHCFYDSGKHHVVLLAQAGTKVDSVSKELILRPPGNCMVLMKTSLGDLVMELSELTPVHLDNFVRNVESGYYVGLQFHRVISNFMVQGGDNKTRKSGRKFDEPEEIDSEILTSLHHVRGALAAARMPNEMNPDKRSSGSQFYIVDGAEMDEKKLKRIRAEKLFEYTEDQIQSYYDLGGAPQLDGEYTIFGRLVRGFDTLDKIASTKTDKFDKPLEPVTILEARMLN